ncbi:DUF2808 domain-containing protein [Nostoc sp. FACHB-152]|uniref:DUF2808 domain-containing protein n=1 Tax=unclassified Nostoc TaxID=2593658 RepID=UPI001685A25A|nr:MULTISPECIES: DUF2808 domain-containing protein [unclassified Nostoc]MBD2449141.1 DUF2808 domain-containing protein [Nostoc sp. FACHB-152]MBD2470398.1 DUF2808 domain-containing protein [Nostoc sp. FACHB-145]
MRPRVLLGAAIASITLIEGCLVSQSQAIQLQDGTVYFAQPPRLVETATTYNEVYVWGATYYFTISLPENAGEGLQSLTINQREGVDNIRFDLSDTVAFEGKRSGRGQKLGLKDVKRDRKTRTVSLTFDPPVSPGKTITIGLKPWQNPRNTGVYLFGVTAFPPGEKSHGQFLGYGRLQFYNHSDSLFWPRGFYGIWP